MKKFVIIFIVTVLIMTFFLIRSTTVYEEGHGVNETEIAKYKEKISNTNNNISEETMNILVNFYVTANTKKAEYKTIEGKSFGEAFRISLGVSFLCYLILYILICIRKLHYGERFGGYFAGDRINDSTEIYIEKKRYDYMKRIRDNFLKNK